ncbi:sugar ABC transporter permease, partial [Streptomyces mirabilis]
MSTAAPPQKAAPRRERAGGRLSNGAFALLLTAPGIALFATIIVYPLVSALFTGFFRQDLRLPGREFVGLENFAHWLNGDLFTILEQTLVFTIGATLAPFAIG